MRLTHTILLASLLMAACGPGNKPQIAPQQRAALEKAKGVDSTVQKQAEEQKKEEERQTQ